VLDTLRAYARLDVIPLPDPGHPTEPGEEDHHDPHEMWEVIQSMLPALLLRARAQGDYPLLFIRV
jgi:hypothetical protein